MKDKKSKEKKAVTRKMHPIMKVLLLIIAVCMGIIMIILTTLTVSAYKEDLSILAEPLPKSLTIMDKDGEIVSELSSSKFTYVSLSEMPEILISAIVGVEDKRYYDHSGIDIKGIGRSVWRNLGAGSIVGGGSTITQQLAKNLFLTSEQTYTRKIKEIIIAFRIEAKYNKDEILELYLNQIYFGEGKWGVQDAAMVYFGKDIQNISISEAGLLAALPKAPTHYSPFQNMEKAIERRNLVLNLLFDQEVIDQNQLDLAVNEQIVLTSGDHDTLSGEFPGYVDYVLEEAIDKYGFSEQDILKGGLQIQTQMDPVVQRSIESAYGSDELFPPSNTEELVQSGSVVLDPRTGGIRGMVGYRGKHSYGGFNRATKLKRQPGSAIKPLAVYAPALENGYKQDSMLLDEKTSFNGYTPTNPGGNYRGEVSLYDALVYSINVPAVALLDEICVQTGIDFLKKAGIPLHEKDINLSIALGGFTDGVSPLEMAQGFSMFPNLGTMKTAHAITKITSSEGKVLLAVKEESVEVMKPENAYSMTQMLMGVITEGTGKSAALDRPVAGKTGTTQLPATEEFKGLSGARDAWFVGYTPELVTAVWVGYDKNDPKLVMESSGGNHPAKIFKVIMSQALENTESSDFEKPKNYKEPRKKDKKKKRDKKEKENKEDEEERREEEEEREEEEREREEERKEDEEEREEEEKQREDERKEDEKERKEEEKDHEDDEEKDHKKDKQKRKKDKKS